MEEIFNQSIPASNRGGTANLYQCGFQHCAPLHSFGPAIRDHYLIHCVLSGKGTFQVGERKFPLSAGQGFLIHPDISTTYTADATDPWYYCWVGFGGDGCAAIMSQCGLSLEQPILSFKSPKKNGKMCQRNLSKRYSRYQSILIYSTVIRFFCAAVSGKRRQTSIRPRNRRKRHGIRFEELFVWHYGGGTGKTCWGRPQSSVPDF